MTLLNPVASILLLIVLSYAMPERVRVTDSFKVTPYAHEKSTLELLTGSRSVGGKGIAKDVRFEKCTTDKQGMCVMSYKDRGSDEMVFVPSVSSKGFGFILRIFAAGANDQKIIALEHKFPDLCLDARKEYVLTLAGGPTTELKGSHLTVQWEISRLADKKVEICSEGNLYIS